MTTKIKTTLLITFFLFGLLTGLQAQEKYEFASVTQVSRVILEVSIQGKSMESISLPKGIQSYNEHQQLFDYISKMQDEGWEVFNTLYGDPLQFIIVLRRKKKN